MYEMLNAFCQMNCLIRGTKIFIEKATVVHLVHSIGTAISLRCLEEPAIGPSSEIRSNLIFPSKIRFYI
jgi:hypothetical protein